MNLKVAEIEMVRVLGPADSHAATLTGIFKWLLPAYQANDQRWMHTHALVYREAKGHLWVAVAGEGMELHVNDVIQTGPNCLLAVHFVMGGERGVNKSSMVQVLNERTLGPMHVGFLASLERQAGIAERVLFEDNKHLLIQPGGSAMSIKG